MLDVGNDPENPEYDASGPTVPLAARMEQSAAAGTILMTAATRMQAGNLIEVAEQPAISVKGITELVEVFQLVNLLSATDASMESTRHTFVGRSIELAQFRSLLDTCVDRGHGHVVFVRGEAGIGKSRLVEELSTIAQQSGFQLPS